MRFKFYFLPVPGTGMLFCVSSNKIISDLKLTFTPIHIPVRFLASICLETNFNIGNEFQVLVNTCI